MPRIVLRSILVIFYVIINHAHASIETGNLWPKQQQQADGSFYSANTTSTPTQATAEALKALDLPSAPTANSLTDAAKAFLNSQPLDSLEDLARSLPYAPKDNETKSKLINNILQYSNLKGGFGDYIGHESSVLATIFALNGLRDLDASANQKTQNAIQFLLKKQKSDGGWAEESNYSSTYVTALASQVLQRYKLEYEVENPIAQANQYLLRQQNSAGGWSSSLETAQATLALIINSSGLTTYQTGIEKLTATQGNNGSWHHDVFTTAVALRALQLAQNPPAITHANSQIIVGTLTSNNLPIANASIEINSTETRQLTDPLGRFEIKTLAAGSYQLLFKAEGFQSQSRLVTLPSASRLDLGTINLIPANNVPAPSLVTGALLGSGSETPIAHGTISINGPNNRTSQVNTSGQFTLENLAPGSYTLTYLAEGFVKATQTIAIPANTRVELGNIVLSRSTQTSVIAGRIIDANNNTPIPDATVTLTNAGGIFTNVRTDALGNYSAEIAANKTLAIAIEHPNYQAIKTSAQAQAGQRIMFSPSLFPLNNPLPTLANVSGIVLDAKTQQPISQVTVSLAGPDFSTQTNTDGLFNFAGLSQGNIELTLTAPGYQTTQLSGALVPGTAQLGEIYLQPKAAQQLTLQGQITDNQTGLPIVGARISVPSGLVSSSADGRYQIQLNEVTQNILALQVQANGYDSSEFNLVLGGTGIAEINIALQKNAAQVIAISALATDKSEYGAYSTVVGVGTLRNTGDANQTLVTQVKVINSSGSTLEEFSVSADPTSFATPLNLAPQQELKLPFNWHTQNYPPGTYTLQWSVFAKNTLQLLAQAQKLITIEPTVKIASLKLLSSPDQTNQGAKEELKIQAAVRNQSNVPTEVRISYDFSDPNGSVIYSHPVSFMLPPNSVFSVIPLETLEHTFVRSGDYNLSLKVLSENMPDLTEGSVISAAPGVQINISQEINPNVVAPSPSERAKIQIRLEGKEATQ